MANQEVAYLYMLRYLGLQKGEKNMGATKLEKVEKQLTRKVGEISEQTSKWCEYVLSFGHCAYSDSWLEQIVDLTKELNDLTNELEKAIKSF